MRLKFSLAAFAVAVAMLVGCGAPVTIQTPQGKAAYTADQVVTRLGEFQSAVIDAARANKLPLADARVIVTWVSGDSRAVPLLLGAVDALRSAPDGAKATLQASWEVVKPRVLANPALATWVPQIDALLEGLQ